MPTIDQKSDREKEIEFLLLGWGKLRPNYEGVKGYPTQTPYRRLEGGSIGSATIDDATALEIDKHLARVSLYDSDAIKFARLVFRDCIPLDDIHKRIKKYTPAKARSMKKFIITWVMCSLDG